MGLPLKNIQKHQLEQNMVRWAVMGALYDTSAVPATLATTIFLGANLDASHGACGYFTVG